MSTAKQKLELWLENNPDGYYSVPMKDIAEESNTSVAAVSQIVPRLIAKRDGVLPSEVKEKRFSNTQGRIDRSKMWEMVRKGMSTADIAFILDCNEGSIRAIMKREHPQ